MEFTKPTTLEEMYAVLKQIYYHYRLKKQTYQDNQMKELSIARLEYQPLTDEQLTEKATELLMAKSLQTKSTYLFEINSEIAKLNQTLNELPKQLSNRLDSIEQSFEKSKEQNVKTLNENGLSESSVLVGKIAELEIAKNSQINQVVKEFEDKETEARSSLTSLQAKLGEADEYCLELNRMEVEAKFYELKQKQEQTVREVFKYNNGLDEKEQRYANTIISSNANLELKFLSILSQGFTKEQLVEMGYYKDAIDCVCAYFDTLEPMQAARDVTADTNLVIYLDDYYESIVYMYQQRVFGTL